MPGLNPCIKAVVNRVVDDGHEVVGIRRGWAALVQHDLDDPGSQSEWFQPLTPSVVRTIDRTGGTFLHTSRTNPSRVRPDDVIDDRFQGSSATSRAGRERPAPRRAYRSVERSPCRPEDLLEARPVRRGARSITVGGGRYARSPEVGRRGAGKALDDDQLPGIVGSDEAQPGARQNRRVPRGKGQQRGQR